jgi:hypothetical protein
MVRTGKAELDFPWIQDGVRAAVAEIQRRSRERGIVIEAYPGGKQPVILQDEMRRIIMDFIQASYQGTP